MCKNPFRRLRGDLSLHEFAALLNVSISMLQQLERGVIKAPSKALLKLHSIGYDPEKIQAEYDAWRQEEQRRAIERLKAESFLPGGGAA